MAEEKGKNTQEWYKRLYVWIKPKAVKVIDRTAQVVAAGFILATSFSYIRDWLLKNQVNYDFSLVGAILVMSVALYLVIRKR